MKSLLTLLTLGASLLAASAQIFTNFNITINVAQEVPTGGGRTGSGSGTVTLNTNANTLTLNNIFFSGLSTGWSADHFHAPAGPGTNASVIYSLVPFTSPGVGSTTGLISGILTLTNGALGFTIAQQISQLESGLWYLNVHSSAFPGGEIRGQVIPVPEPSVVLLSSAAFGLLVLRWRRNRR